jgi:hypothetical protein
MSNNNTQQYDLDRKGNHLTEQGLSYVEIYIQDRLTGQALGSKWIKRAELARHFHEKTVVGSRNNKFIVQF